MTQVGESIGSLVAIPNQNAPCWACDEQSPEKKTNELDEDPSGKQENKLGNNASILGGNLGPRPSWTITVPSGNDSELVTSTVVPAAHHLIPGKESLKRVPELLKFIESSHGTIKADIGYDVNSAKNGVWLPGNYAVRGGPFATTWSKYDHKKRYAVSAMKKARAQFHDRHAKYSAEVKKSLRALADKMRAVKPDRCGICNKELCDLAQPPYGLVGRLDNLSNIYRSFLRGPTRKWPVESGILTSRWSEEGKKEL